MAGRTHQPQRLHLFTDPADPDVVLVLTDDSVSCAIPVILN
jgi:hypothetical protein